MNHVNESCKDRKDITIFIINLYEFDNYQISWHQRPPSPLPSHSSPPPNPPPSPPCPSPSSPAPQHCDHHLHQWVYHRCYAKHKKIRLFFNTIYYILYVLNRHVHFIYCLMINYGF